MNDDTDHPLHSTTSFSHNPINAALRFSIKKGGREWRTTEVSEAALAACAASPPTVNEKDGTAICPALLESYLASRFVPDGSLFGVLKPLRLAIRGNEYVQVVSMLIYDIENNKQTIKELKRRLKKFRALIYTTFSHNPEGVTIIRLKDLMRFVGIDANSSDFDPTTEHIASFLIAKEDKGGLGCKADPSTFKVSGTCVIDGEPCIRVEHEPLYRYRVIIFLTGPVGAEGSEFDWSPWEVERRRRFWRHAYLGFAVQLGLDVDPACAGLSHASYLPCSHIDRLQTYEWAFIPGDLLAPSVLAEIGDQAVRDEDEKREAFRSRTDNADDLDEIRAALQVIPASCEYVVWRNIIWAVKSAFAETDLEDAARNLMDEWSQTDPLLYSTNSFDRVWEDGRADVEGGITLGTFWHIAGEHGFNRLAYNRVRLFSSLF
jgi:hypothetical protein